MTDPQPAPRTRGRPGNARPRLLEAAIAEFAARGFEGASTAGIARAAGVPQPLVHHHFGSKEGIFEAALAELFAELSRELLATPPEATETGELLRRFVRFTARRPQLVRIWIIESGRPGPHVARIDALFVQPLTALFEAVVADTMRRGHLAAVDPALALYAVQGLACYPFLVPEQVRRTHGDPADSAFADAYADAVTALILRR